MVEIIVALTVLSISILAIFAALRTCSQAARYCEMLTKAQLLAETLLNETMLKQTIAYQTIKTQKGPFHCQVQITPTEIENLGAVCVQISWQEQKAGKNYQLYSLLYTPPLFEGK